VFVTIGIRPCTEAQEGIGYGNGGNKAAHASLHNDRAMMLAISPDGTQIVRCESQNLSLAVVGQRPRPVVGRDNAVSETLRCWRRSDHRTLICKK
jgi:hypothetical protein